MTSAISAGRAARQKRRAEQRGAPHPAISGLFTAQQPRSRITHVEHMPKLGKGERQEGHRHRRFAVEVQP